MTATMLRDEADLLARTLLDAVPGLVVTAWGSTARRERTPSSDLDLMCWNPGGAELPALTVQYAQYLDLVACTGGRGALRGFATANATDLHAVMFSEVIGGDPALVSAFEEVVGDLWRDSRLRAQEVCHLLATAVLLPAVHGATLYRPEKFALGATRCWTALAECGALIEGRSRHHATEPVLGALAAQGLVEPGAPAAFATAMRLRRDCEQGRTSHREQQVRRAALAAEFLASVRRLLDRRHDWLAANAPLDSEVLQQLAAVLTGTAIPARAEGTACRSEPQAMLQVFLAGSARQVRAQLERAYGGSWWVRHAALMNPHTDAATLRLIVRQSASHRRRWADRNLLLYALRHPNASQGLLDDIARRGHPLRPMDCEAARAAAAALADRRSHHSR
ncbi:hypothetical protein E6W39_00170 [Kitasatospora acidiphila]|uniref:Uncharacterized protein n=1 Tax=Kitasatospora acidiphila TaxID=2567942 RepID=A0A540WG99_9ACTN|nr:hypothetical protein [Kitasatospora acidiphila]TQF08012.1 hypothetical protein E6W39_00170 [Kitasatospora acidiphila]